MAIIGKASVLVTKEIETREDLDALPDWTIIQWGSRVGRTQKNTISSLDGGDVVLDKDEVVPCLVLWVKPE